MTAERFRQIRNVFDATLEQDTSARTAFLEQACHGDDQLRLEVEQLLRARDQDTGWLDADAVGAAGRLEGRRIGPYEILRSLGEGGMGTVYLAARADSVFRKLFALKIVRPETATAEVLRRFQQEREILASLEHPNIACVIDGGETPDGLPYLVMEYVDGKPIGVYCDEHRLTVKERLALFEQVCSAVRYAHTQNVVHRDLKPSNVLVTTVGEVKLLDFGIAKLLAASEESTSLRTRSDLLLMTPEYASPEQIRGESVTVSSDVYTLGVVLYELLTGRRPYRLRSRIFHEVIRVICEEPPTRPSTVVTQRGEAEDDQDRALEALSRMRGVSPKDLRRELAGNLDGILLKALEKNSPQRYRSVAELSEDLQSHLRGESVRAQRDAGSYALRTFAQRHPWWIIAAAGLALAGWNGLIPWEAWLVGLPIVTSVAVGSWLACREYGARFPPKLVEMGLKIFSVCFLAVFSFYSLLKGALHLNSLTALSVIKTTLTAWVLYILLRWPLRKKLLGRLLLEASLPRSRPLVAIVAIGLGLQGLVVGRAIADENWSYRVMFILELLFTTTFLIYTVWVFRRVEVREQGVAAGGSFLRWRRIVGYSWEHKIGEVEMLRFRLTGLWKWSSFIQARMLVKRNLRPQVDHLLKQQLMEWPRGSSQ